MRKNDPIKAQYAVVIVSLVLYVLYIVFMLILTIVRGQNPFQSVTSILFMFSLLCFLWAGIAIYRTHKRMEKRRKRALAGDQSLLADPQPVPDEHALPVPSSLIMHLNMKFQFIVAGFVLLCFLVGTFAGFFAASGGRILSNLLAWIILGIILVLLIVVLLLSVLFSRFLYNRILKQEITIHEQGITTKFYGKTTTVLWNEAQCFALWGGKTKRMVAFELIGQNGVVRWIVPNQYRLFYPFRPTIPFEEYCKKINALQQVVVAKTRQPLFDLRDKKIYWW